MSRLSIITINYNNLSGLEKTMQSVLEQGFSDFEYIVIDGGSTDGSVDLIKKNADQLAYWISEKDNGIFSAHNKGLQQTTGEYCLFLNSGDFLIDRKVLAKVFAEPHNEDILYGNMLIDWGKGKLKLGKMPSEITLFQMYKDTLWHPVSFIKRSLFEKLGDYDESYKFIADYEFFFRALIVNKASAKHLGLTISVFTADGTSSQVENIPRIKEERERVLSTYLSKELIEEQEQKLEAELAKKKRFFNRLINKLR